MPRNYQPQEENRLGRLGAIDQFVGEDVNPQALVAMLASLYGIQQEQENNPYKQQAILSQIGENQAHGQYYNTLADEYSSSKRKMLEDMQAMTYMFGGPDNIPTALKREMLKKGGYDPDSIVPQAPEGEMTAPQPHAQVSVGSDNPLVSMSPVAGIGKYNDWVLNQLGFPNPMEGLPPFLGGVNRKPQQKEHK